MNCIICGNESSFKIKLTKYIYSKSNYLKNHLKNDGSLSTIWIYYCRRHTERFFSKSEKETYL